MIPRLSIHSITTKPWNLGQSIEAGARSGALGMTVWRDALQAYGIEHTVRHMRDARMVATGLCRSGFFPSKNAAARQKALEDTGHAIEEAVQLGTDLVVLVCGACPGMPLAEARTQIQDAIACLEPHARRSGVRLAIEPLHPMYAAERSAIVTLGQARSICEYIDSPWVGVALDVYHCWWDPQLADEIVRISALKRLFAFHICDWRLETRDLLNDRGLMGEGCIDIAGISAQVDAHGFTGWREVEIFSTERWKGDQQIWHDSIVTAYQRLYPSQT